MYEPKKLLSHENPDATLDKQTDKKAEAQPVKQSRVQLGKLPAERLVEQELKIVENPEAPLKSESPAVVSPKNPPKGDTFSSLSYHEARAVFTSFSRAGFCN